MNSVRPFLLGLLVAALMAVSFAGGRLSVVKRPQTPPEVQRDTLYIRDTITATKPVYFVRHELDTVWIQALDTHRDTGLVALPREQVEWRDSLATVWASGVGVEVDSVRHYATTRVVTVREVQKMKARWALGVQAGYGAGKDGLSPFVGVGVTWAVLSW